MATGNTCRDSLELCEGRHDLRLPEQQQQDVGVEARGHRLVLWCLPGSCRLPLAGLATLQVQSQQQCRSRRAWLKSQKGSCKNTRGPWSHMQPSCLQEPWGACLKLQVSCLQEHCESLLGITTRLPAGTLGDLGSTCNQAACRNTGGPAWNYKKAPAGTLGDLGSTCNQAACRNTGEPAWNYNQAACRSTGGPCLQL
jgi:hypothetical protein